MAKLRPRRDDAAALYSHLVAEARRPGWYTAGGVPDTIDGRFRVLATLAALATLRLEAGDEAAVRHSVRLTEAFVDDMEAQLREAGIGDPTVGKRVRALVGSLAKRVDLWRPVLAEEQRPGFAEAVRASLYPDEAPGEAAETFAGEELRRLHEGLDGISDRNLIEGRIG
ncbi:ubiquinol-cytochrome C chaperone family protein [Sphingomonas sp. ASV193]|uniref:ubiquinol-cytochrome C chaperone family protein n=1 Tax=Sphingomonas sp. ASV193 TaxID=3144405 RepID=UPI0032E8D5F0